MKWALTKLIFAYTINNYGDNTTKHPVLRQTGLKGSLHNDRQERWGCFMQNIFVTLIIRLI